MSQEELQVGLVQMAPVWLDKHATTEKIIDFIKQGAAKGCQLLAFGEALLPGYPFWIELTGGARFNAEDQKQWYSHYVSQAIDISAGDLTPICQAAKEAGVAVYLGTMEKAPDRGGHSLYCSMVYIDGEGEIGSVHRKLMPTYEERLAWSPGDGHGLRVHKLGAFTLGGLNCWENWMPLPRAALYAMGEDLHVAIWPGGDHNTGDITRFIAKEGRSYVMSVSGLLTPQDIPLSLPYRDEMLAGVNKGYLANGASCLAGPDGEWVIPPQLEKEGIFTAVIHHGRVREERQNFDPVGHYSRPDVTQLRVNRERQSTLKIEE